MTAPCTPFFNRSGGFGITGSPSTGWTFTKTAEANTAEVVATFKLDETTTKLTIENSSTTNAVFAPRIKSISNTGNGLSIVSQAGDTGTTPMIVFDVNNNAGAAIATRPLYSFRNLNVAVADVSAKGAWAYTVIHTDSSTENIAVWSLDEDTTSRIRFDNASGTNATFIPEIRGIQSGTQPGLQLIGQSTTDTGAIGCLRLYGRIGTSSSPATRPSIQFYSGSTEVAQFTAAGNLALVNGMSLGLRMDLKSYTVATLPAAGAAGGVIFVSDAGGNGPCIAVSNGTNWKRCDNVSTTVV